jgi:hypothetical protein
LKNNYYYCALAPEAEGLDFARPAEMGLDMLETAIKIIEEWEGQDEAMATDLAIRLFRLYQVSR